MIQIISYSFNLAHEKNSCRRFESFEKFVCVQVQLQGVKNAPLKKILARTPT
jgi:hypothetical protein